MQKENDELDLARAKKNTKRKEKSKLEVKRIEKERRSKFIACRYHKFLA